MKKIYTPLHVHSHYSLLDGLSKPSQIANRCSKIGVNACALTDHGTISGCVQFFNHMKAANIKPILGCEIYLSHKNPTIKEKDNAKLSHCLILAKNLKGWKSLIKLVSSSNNPEYFYHKPRLDINTLKEYANTNLICICGHLGSYLADKILHKDQIVDDWKSIGSNVVSEFKEMFGHENFYVETQLMDQENTPIQKILTQHIRSLGEHTNTRVVCTPDAHYCSKEDAVDQRVLLCNNLKTTFPDIQRKINNDENIGMDCFFNSDNYHILSPEEIIDLHTEEEIENTNYVASLCEDYDILDKPSLPPFSCPNNDPAEYLRQLCRNGWRDKIHKSIPQDQQDIYVERVKYELEVLQQAGLSSYFLIVQDIVEQVSKNGWLPGPGRGSAAGCLVSYLIGITSIDPIKYSLMFDRFYNAGRNTKDRVSMPDIDVDVPINKREQIISYIKNKYGSHKVSQMITFNTMKGRGALKDVLRVYGNISFEEMNNITKHIPDEAKIADELQEMKEEYGESSIIRWALENNPDSLKDWCYIDNDSNELAGPLSKRFEQAIRLEGTKSNQSKHAAGIVIGKENLSELCPMIYDTKNKQLIAGMEMQDLESIGLIKFDILGVAMLDKIMEIQSLLLNGDK